MLPILNKYSTMRRLLHLTILCFLLSSMSASAANLYWRGQGFGNWSLASNWATNAGGTNILATAPGPNDVAIFNNAGNGLVLMDVPVNIQKIQINQNFAGTLISSLPVTLTGFTDGLGFEMLSQAAIVVMSQTAPGAFQCLSGFSQLRGAFNLTSLGNNLIQGDFLVDGAGTDNPTFSVTTGVQLTFGGNFELTDPSTFATLANSTIIFRKASAGPTTIDINPTGVSTLFNNVVFDESANNTGDNHVNFTAGTELVVVGLLDIQSGIIGGDATSGLVVLGNVQSSGTNTAVGPGSTTHTAFLEFSGTTNQTVNFPGTDLDKWSGPVVFNIPTGNPSTVSLLSPWLLNRAAQTATFSNGIVLTTGTNRLIFGPGAVAVGANVNSFVDGPVEKRSNGTTSFNFPVGDAGFYAPVNLSGAGGFNTAIPGTADYLVEYFQQNPNPTYNTNSQSTANPPVHVVSQTEYWSIDQITGASTSPTVWLSYESLRSGGITDPSTLGVSAWESPGWWALFGQTGFFTSGGADFVGSFPANTVNQINYDPVFTLSTIDPIANPLPVNWLSFTGRYFDGAVELTWSTALELNNESYSIERSADGHSFKSIGTVAGRGTTNLTSTYSFKDEQPLTGVGFYRIKQIDTDGKFSYSKGIKVSSSESVLKALRLYPNPAVASTPLTMENTNWRNKKVNVTVYNAIGGIVYQQQITFGSDSRAKLNLSGLKKGNYFISSYLNGEKQSLPFIVQ